VPAHAVRSLDDLDRLRGWLAERDGTCLLDCKVDLEVRAEWLQEAFKGGA
jgi:hypothetical protein